jgi:hypothetical protein
MINRGPFGYKFKVDDIHLMSKKQINIILVLDFDTWLLWLEGNSSISTPWTGVWPRDHTENAMFYYLAISAV